jgi:hypothetical protein
MEGVLWFHYRFLQVLNRSSTQEGGELDELNRFNFCRSVSEMSFLWNRSWKSPFLDAKIGGTNLDGIILEISVGG